LAGTQYLWQIKTFNSEIFAGLGTFDSFELSSDHSDAVKYSFSMTGDGAYTIT